MKKKVLTKSKKHDLFHCFKCGKPLICIEDTGYSKVYKWPCDCMDKRVRLSVG